VVQGKTQCLSQITNEFFKSLWNVCDLSKHFKTCMNLIWFYCFHSVDLSPGTKPRLLCWEGFCTLFKWIHWLSGCTYLFVFKTQSFQPRREMERRSFSDTWSKECKNCYCRKHINAVLDQSSFPCWRWKLAYIRCLYTLVAVQ